MRLKTIYEIADGLAPFALSREYCEKYDSYDNSGVQLDCGGEVSGVLFSLDLSERAIGRAKELGANCIFTHHPAIFRPLRALEQDGAGKRILACARAGISVLSAHLNLDAAEGGIDDCLMRGLGGTRAEAVMHLLDGGGYGKIYSVPTCAAAEFAKKAEAEFGAKRLTLYAGNRPVRKVASFCGAGTDDETVAFALRKGADTFVSSDAKHHLIAELAEAGLNVVLLTHYAAENYGFYRFYLKINEKMKESGVRTEFFSDERFL